MGETQLRMFFGDRPATQAELEHIEEIVVEQEIDAIWEARIRLALCLDENGRWRNRQDEFAAPSAGASATTVTRRSRPRSRRRRSWSSAASTRVP